MGQRQKQDFQLESSIWTRVMLVSPSVDILGSGAILSSVRAASRWNRAISPMGRTRIRTDRLQCISAGDIQVNRSESTFRMVRFFFDQLFISPVQPAPGMVPVNSFWHLHLKRECCTSCSSVALGKVSDTIRSPTQRITAFYSLYPHSSAWNDRTHFLFDFIFRFLVATRKPV